ncbi:glycine N-acyltransferase-like protein 3 [Chanos chanos]|uniref:Glycine N-acyltransferase-like protein n=1 Tax=Chanos chanos TaxID=29144 RepID=A0A6J2V7D9_CHACN|nr:glycine N-acyltransferase-like protein 3 [Chanos chanos]
MEVLTADKLKTAETFLKNYLPQSQQAYSFIFLINRARVSAADVLVDQWPDFSAIIIKPKREKEGDVFKDICVFARNEDTVRKVLADTNILDWQTFLCLGVDLCYEEVVWGVAKSKAASGNRVSVCHMMTLKDPSHLPPTDSSALKVSSLNESHVTLVNSTWKFAQEEHSMGMIRNMILNFPSCCLLDTAGQPVAWILTYESCAIGMLYTVPEHRGKGYAKALVTIISKKLFSQGYPVYCFIEEENQVSYRLFSKLGFTEDPSYRATWFHFNSL